jgi:hypothetical protein
MQRLRRLDFAAIAVLVITWLLSVALINRISFEPFLLTIFITAAFMSFAALLIRRIASVVLFALAASSTAALAGTFGTLGSNAIPVLAVAGLAFEAVLMAVRAEIKNVPLNLVLGAGLAAASMPWTMLLLANQTAKSLLPLVWNLSITAFFIGVAGAVVSFLIWYYIKNTKPIIKFEYAV